MAFARIVIVIFLFTCLASERMPARGAGCTNLVNIPTDSIRIEPVRFHSRGGSAEFTFRYYADSTYYVALRIDDGASTIVGPLSVTGSNASFTFYDIKAGHHVFYAAFAPTVEYARYSIKGYQNIVITCFSSPGEQTVTTWGRGL